MIKLSAKNWVINNIDTVLFDKDGTIIDLHYFWGKMTELRASEIIKIFQLPQNILPKLCFYLGYDFENKKMLSDGITAMYSRSKIIEIFCSNLSTIGVHTTEKQLEEIFDCVSENFYREIEKYTKPIDEAIDFIKTLRSLGIKTGIVTSDSIKSTELTLKQFSWESLFDVVIGRESTNSPKESGEGTKLAMSTILSKPQNTVMIGDAPMDHISAKNAGIEHTILVATGQISQKALLHTSQYTAERLDELEIIIL